MTGTTTRRPRWHDAGQALEHLRGRPSDRRTLWLLARLPLIPEPVIEQLSGIRNRTSIYQSLSRLRADGLIDALHPSVVPGRSPRLPYLTDLGLAVVALDRGIEPEALANRHGLRGSDLLGLLPGLPQLLADYELLGLLAASRPGHVKLLAWERPWRRRSERPAAKTPAAVRLPAGAALSWKDAAGAYLLLPDLVTFPVRAYRSTLDHLFVLRGHHDGMLPPLVIATRHPGRIAAWERLLEETRRARLEAPLQACAATWAELQADPGRLARLTDNHPAEPVTQPGNLQPFRLRRPASRLPSLVGDPFREAGPRSGIIDSLGCVALHLTATDRRLLDLVGRHPFLTPDRLAVVLGWQQKWVRRRRNRLIGFGLMRLVEPAEIGDAAESMELVELTRAGLELVSAQQGLSLMRAVRLNGLAGGGPDAPFGARRVLLKNLAHTLAVDGIFVSLIRTAGTFTAAGWDDALLEWRNAAACSRGHLRPDGYGVYRHQGRSVGFFVELDRGTMNRQDYLRKFAAYHRYHETGRFARDYQGFPTILVVTTTEAAEERIARAVRLAAIGRQATLPLLLTCQWRLDDPGNPEGLLGPIWRTLEAAGDDRQRWPARTPIRSRDSGPVGMAGRVDIRSGRHPAR